MEPTYTIAHAAGWDAGNKSMKSAGRTQWSDEDYSIATEVMNRIFAPFDTMEWGDAKDCPLEIKK